MNCVCPWGIVYTTGILGSAWTFKEFRLMATSHTVPLTVYMGEAKSQSAELLQEFVECVADGKNNVKIDRTFTIDEIVEAHTYMESNQARGKLVVLVNEE